METAKDVESYIANVAEEARAHLMTLRHLILETVPEAVEGISYKVPFYKYQGEFVGFAAYSKHVSFGFGAGVLTQERRALLKEQGYRLGKGTLNIAFDQVVPIEAVRWILLEKARQNEIGKS